ncbi:hypothetical protein J9303_07765, partial [Bacillaceae bacterium Marseille-Q3522]|nr:hypothetical protein [Bacillaceae bacterium Marseille-Q3522]
IRYHNKIYIVWLDPEHNMNPDQRYGGVKYYDVPLTPFQEIELNYNQLIDENEKLIKENEVFLEEICRLEEKIEKLKNT